MKSQIINKTLLKNNTKIIKISYQLYSFLYQQQQQQQQKTNISYWLNL